ncbi:MAG TPA: cytochrome c-type biogenesis protein CcmH [Polyangiaceae bacterium]|nr:cytochrome c-type biogenesis protein CcmH [Polyangiaceae bacterium]
MVQSSPPTSPLRRRWTLGALLCALLIGSVAPSAVAQRDRDDERAQTDAVDAPSRGTSNVSPEVAQRAAAIARQTMSPFCPGRTLSDCPSEYATAWRRDIRAMVARGMSADEIQRELESRVGANLSGSPHRGAGYGVSIGLALGAALVLFFVLSRLRQNSIRRKQSSAVQAADAAGPSREAGSSSAKQGNSVVDDERLESELRAVGGDDDD